MQKLSQPILQEEDLSCPICRALWKQPRQTSWSRLFSMLTNESWWTLASVSLSHLVQMRSSQKQCFEQNSEYTHLQVEANGEGWNHGVSSTKSASETERRELLRRRSRSAKLERPPSPAAAKSEGTRSSRPPAARTLARAKSASAGTRPKVWKIWNRRSE